MVNEPPKPPVLHAIIAGFGVPGRSAHEALCLAGWEVSVIERNPATVDRCRAGMSILHGDATDVETLRTAGLQIARLLVVALPDEASVLQCIDAARSTNATVPIVARTYFTSSAFEAKRRGATDVVIAEQVIATAMGERVREAIEQGRQ